MASSPVTAPAPKAAPPNDTSPPPKTSPPPPQVSSPPPEATKSPPPPDEAKSPPPDEPKSPPPPDEAKSPPPEAKSPPPPPMPTPPAATPPPKTSPPPIITPPPSSPPPTNINPPLQPTSPPPPQNPLIPTPPISSNNPPGAVFTPPTPGAFYPPPPNVPEKHRTPSHHTPSSSNGGSSSPSSSNDTIGDKLPIIVGITVGLGLLFITMIVVIVVCSKKRKKGTPMNNQLQYYGNPPPQGPKGTYYDNNPPNWYNNNPQMMDHQGNKMGPPPGILVPPPPGAAWGPPPPAAANSSSEMGSNLSDPPHMLPASPNGLQVNKSSFSYDELAAATNGFSQANLLGQGGFGYVHKGVLPNGKVVAVKSLKSGSGQGEREFQAEVEIISRVHHRHLVSLVGYCIAGGQRMLVYEFVPNKTLEFHLHGKGCPTMDWSKRMKIAMGAAKGLAYLHEDCHPRIIHRDIKTANILIDNNFEAMVADFGLAKLSSDTYTHVSTRIMGTFGYLAPEYASSGKLTEKSDVFSFGVMLLELITGRRPVDTSNTYMEDSLVDWARPILTRPGGDYQELVDPRLEGNYDSGEMACMIACASASIRHSARRRPKMSQIVRALEGDVSLEMLNEGVKPGQSAAFTSTEYDDSSYNASLQKFKKMAMESQEVGNTENSGLTSTYGLNPSSSSDSSSGEVNQVPKIHHQY